ncbi:MAG: NADH-quinone oxidoreductase subunit C [Deltaproteobacteria bacterium]|nr:NADH-quinone oxidoreductase subunit C [Deltaproteobacteria bacterium]
MSQAVVDRLNTQFRERVLEMSDAFGDHEVVVSDAFGDHEVVVALKDWAEVAQFMKDDPDIRMDHFIDLTAVDYPERETARFDLVLMTRSSVTCARIRLRTYVKDGEEPGTLSSIWSGANWAEREVWDMFGIKFAGHPDMRRILLYEEFVGHPLRKDYPIDKAQPLVPYREVARIDWESRLAGGDDQVSPAIGVQQGQRRTLSDSEAARQIQARIDARMAKEAEAAQATEETSVEGSGE